MSIAETIAFVEDRLVRRLEPDEVAMASQMVEAGKSEDEIVEMLKEPVVIPEDDQLETYRYEAIGEGVLPVPEAEPEGGSDA